MFAVGIQCLERHSASNSIAMNLLSQYPWRYQPTADSSVIVHSSAGITPFVIWYSELGNVKRPLLPNSGNQTVAGTSPEGFA